MSKVTRIGSVSATGFDAPCPYGKGEYPDCHGELKLSMAIVFVMCDELMRIARQFFVKPKHVLAQKCHVNALTYLFWGECCVDDHTIQKQPSG